MMNSTTGNYNTTFVYRIPRVLCPTCYFVKSGEADKQGIQCVLHFNPDPTKYYCLCDGSSPMTHEEKVKEWGEDPDDMQSTRNAST